MRLGALPQPGWELLWTLPGCSGRGFPALLTPNPLPPQWDTYPDVLGLQFSWDGFYKEVGSAFIGCSPEFEFGLYSLCFLARPGRA